jgi:FkbM family methyltransferase
MTLNRLLINIANTLGFDVYKKPGKTYTYMLQLLKNHQINCVLDVGANEGQYAQKLIKYGYQAEILSFEPVASTYKILAENTSNHPHWKAYNFALAAADGASEINISENTVSSSILEIDESHLSAAPNSKYLKKETIQLKKLDSIFFEELDLKNKNVFLKIDTQGFEMEVLKGAENALKNIIGLQLELSITEMYKGEALFDEIIAYLKQRGFELHQIEPGLVNTNTGKLLQFDGIFYKS